MTKVSSARCALLTAGASASGRCGPARGARPRSNTIITDGSRPTRALVVGDTDLI